MKSITLHTAALDNGGERHEAGAEIAIGKGAREIEADRAKGLIDRAMAANTATAAAAKSSAD